MIKGTMVRIKPNNTSSAFRGKLGRIEDVKHDNRLGTYFVVGFDGKVLSYPFYANEFEEIEDD